MSQWHDLYDYKGILKRDFETRRPQREFLLRDHDNLFLRRWGRSWLNEWQWRGKADGKAICFHNEVVRRYCWDWEAHFRCRTEVVVHLAINCRECSWCRLWTGWVQAFPKMKVDDPIQIIHSFDTAHSLQKNSLLNKFLLKVPLKDSYRNTNWEFNLEWFSNHK